MNHDNDKLLAQQNESTDARAEGFAAGEASREGGNPPSSYAMIGIDDYSLGFRAGYFGRSAAVPAHTLDSGAEDSQRRVRAA